MSRVGKMPVVVPQGVDVAMKDDQINVKGALGALALTQNALVTIKNDAGQLTFVPANESREANAMSGTMRQLVNNMVTGVTKGFEKKLNLVGVGFKAQAQGATLNLTVGYSHPVVMDMPAGIQVATPTPTEVVIKGSDRQRVGQIAAEVRAVRPPEPYKGKGIRYSDEKITIKETKKKKKPRRNKELHHVDQKRAAPSSFTPDPHPHCHPRCCPSDSKPYQFAYLRQRHFWRRHQDPGFRLDRGSRGSQGPGRFRQGCQRCCCAGHWQAYCRKGKSGRCGKSSV